MNGTNGQYRVGSTALQGTRRIFVATRLSDGAALIVKRARAGFPAAEEAAALRHEFSVLTRLKGAPVPEAIELIEAPLVSMVMTMAPGESLDVLRGQVDVQRFVACAVEVTRALAAVHDRGFVHRDIKPHHFFIDAATGQAHLVDFGLATHLPRERQRPVDPDAILGTLAYISPEQTGRTSHSVDQRSDLYSLGVTLYELWTGRRPFESDDALELIHAHIARQPPPPGQHRSELPPVLEQLVLRLLAKSPEERYQTAAGVLADLERIQAELTKSGTATPFALGQHDYDGRLRVPERLYGRAHAREALLEAVRSTQGGARALVLVAGSPGVGKSALVQEAHREMVRTGHFVTGKFDQYSRGIPYSALTSACSELVRVYLASTAKELDDWRRRLRSALGDNARVIADVVPELVVALGEQPEVPPLPPNEAQIRFERTFRRFMEASACKEAPLVLFLDDLQWADTASLAVLELVLSSGRQGHLLIIGSYRDSEVDSAHPLSRALERLEQKVRIARIQLEPLSLADVRKLLTDALRLTQHNSDDLATLIFEKTSGNPFFIGQFLERLAEEGHLEFEAGRGYTWNLQAIAGLGATDNVVDLVVARLGGLDPDTQQLLQLAGCIGHTFRLRTLAVIAEREPRAVFKALLPAVRGGFLVPLGQNHRLLEDLLEAGGAAVDTSYRFAHDRIQQAALAAIRSTQRSLTHLRIGRLLLSAAGDGGPDDDQLFEVVAQLNLGRQHVADPGERTRIARLNLAAARRARSAAAHASAAQLALTSVEMLGERPFAVDYETSLQAHFIAAEAYYLLHDDARALEMIDIIEAGATSALDRVPARNLKATIVTNQGRPQDATAISVETLAALGLALPDVTDPAAVGAAIGEAFGAYQAALGSRDVAALHDLPAMDDPEKLAQVATLAGAIPSVFQWNHALMVVLVLKAVRLALEHGTAPVTPFFYAQYGIVHHVVTGDAARAHEFGLLALALSEHPQHAAARGGVEFIYAEFLAPWVRPRRECITHFKRGVESGLDAGDRLHACYCLAVGAAEALYAGQRLTELQDEIPGGLKALNEHGDVLNHLLLEIVGRGIASLLGETSATGSLNGEGFSEQAFEAEGPPPVKAHYGAIKGMVRYLFGDAAEALRVTEAIQPPPGVVFKVDYVFYHGMACVELARSAEPAEREALLTKADADLACFEPWVRVASRNFSALQHLLRAELLSSRGESSAALDAYEHALEAAADCGTVHYLALAYERIGRFHLRENRTHSAQLSLRAAFQEYELWGAAGKLRQLTREFSDLRPTEVRARQFDSTAETIGTASTGGGSRLDLESATRAVSAIASEIRLEPLLRRLTQILLENAGATRGVLLLPEQGSFAIRVALRVQAEQIVTEPTSGNVDAELAFSVVRYCARTLESVVVDDAARDNRFAQDPFVERGHAKSLACLPLVHQTELVGLLYLENDTATRAFHAARIERLEFLAGHAAISLQNAGLYAKLQTANENLERRVQERTAELSARNQDMRRVLDNVRQGLLTIDLDGRLMPEHSRVVDEWLGKFEPGASLASYLAGIDPRFVDNFKLSLQQLLENELPEELLIDQLPTALIHGPRRFQLSYQPIRGADGLSGLLVVIDDVTEALRRARDEAEQKDILRLCQALSEDRAALLGFFEENAGIVEDLVQSTKVDASLRRSLHTLKGNAAMYGFMTLADACHAAEDAIAEASFDASFLEAVGKSFTVLRSTLSSIAGEDAGERVEVSRDTLRALTLELSAGLPAKQAAFAVERLLLEPIAPSLERLGRYGSALAARLGKHEPRIEIVDHGLLVDGKRAAPLFASLVHLVRNAIDHGLESPGERAAAGKAPATLKLHTGVEAGEVIITIRDDGRGIDWARVRERALARGLPAGSPHELSDALFSDAFSTRDEATIMSGRGVGLAAVREEVTRLSGRLAVESELGRGTEFRLFVSAEALGVPRTRQ